MSTPYFRYVYAEEFTPVLTWIVTEPALVTSSGDMTTDVQKKLTSWRSLLPDDVTDDDSQTRRTVGDLVVVCSLVDRLPNLGGENRTWQ